MSDKAIKESSPIVPGVRLYEVVMNVASVVFLVLAVTLFSAPRAFLDGLGLELTSSTDFLSRRAAVLLFALCVLSFFARKPAATRQAVLLSLLVATGAMAVLGTVELARGATSIAILKAVAIEAVLTVLFLLALLRDRSRA